MNVSIGLPIIANEALLGGVVLIDKAVDVWGQSTSGKSLIFYILCSLVFVNLKSVVKTIGAGEMAWRLQVLVVLPEDWN